MPPSRRSRKSNSKTKKTSSQPSSTNSVVQAVDFTTDVATEVVNTLTTITGGIISGANAVVDTTGNVSEQLGEMFDVYATQVFKGAGTVAKTVADKMGDVLRVIPVVGGGVAYIVESTGGGVYHVIVTVGSIGSSTVKRFGKVVKKSTDLVVYTLTAGDGQIRDVGEEVNDLVGRFAKGVTGRGGRRRRQRTALTKRRKKREWGGI